MFDVSHEGIVFLIFILGAHDLLNSFQLHAVNQLEYKVHLALGHVA